jgi:hypothetical protein
MFKNMAIIENIKRSTTDRQEKHLINFPFCLDLKKNNVTILVIKTVPLIRHEIFP